MMKKYSYMPKKDMNRGNSVEFGSEWFDSDISRIYFYNQYRELFVLIKYKTIWTILGVGIIIGVFIRSLF